MHVKREESRCSQARTGRYMILPSIWCFVMQENRVLSFFPNIIQNLLRQSIIRAYRLGSEAIEQALLQKVMSIPIRALDNIDIEPSTVYQDRWCEITMTLFISVKKSEFSAEIKS